MALAMFDLDNTLIAGDSDYLWGKFLADTGVVDAISYEYENQRFYREYHAGTLNIEEFLKFSLRPLSQHDPQQLYTWREQFLTNYIDPIILPAALELVQQHRQRDDTLLVITATNAFVAAPIAHRFAITDVLATTPEWSDGRYTGQVDGVPCFQQGKVICLESWLKKHNKPMHGSFFYTDSHNDLPLLELVDNPIAVDPDVTLHQYAQHRGWPIISLRNKY